MEKEIKRYFQKVNPLKFDGDEKLIEIEKLGRGESNINFLIKTSNNKYLMRFDIVNDIQRFKNEYKILKKIEYLNISQKPILIDVSKKHFKDSFMILSYIEGKSLDKLDKKVYSPYYNKLAKKLAKLHKKKIGFVNKTYSFEKRLIRTNKIIRQLKRDIGHLSEKETILQLIGIYNTNLKIKLKRYKQKLSFCHGDVSLGNVLFRDKEFF
jgi:aminoglycoside phosphotransferase (APT) family kinase protein